MATIQTPQNLTTLVNGIDEFGDYIFKLTAFDNMGNSYEDYVRVTKVQEIAPIINQQPTDKNLIQGDPIALSFTYSGQNVNIKWFKDGIEIIGENTSTYTKISELSDIGDYFAIVSNTYGSVQTDTVSVSVIAISTGISHYYRYQNNAIDLVGVMSGITENITYNSSGITGFSAIYNGSNSLISYGDTYTTGGSDFSLCVWVKISDISISNQAILSKERLGESSSQFRLVFNEFGSTKFVFSMGSSVPGENPYIESTTSPVSSQWYFIVVTRLGNTFKMYINGVLEKENSTTSIFNLNNTNLFKTGANTANDGISNAFLFNGEIDDLSIWERSLTIYNIKYLYNDGAARIII